MLEWEEHFKKIHFTATSTSHFLATNRKLKSPSHEYLDDTVCKERVMSVISNMKGGIDMQDFN